MSKAFYRFVLGAGYSYAFLVGLTYVFRDMFYFSEPISYAIVQVLLLLINFHITRKWVFADAQGVIARQAVGFLLINATFRLIDWVIFNLLLYFWSSAEVWSAIFISMCCVFPVKFLCYRYFVFRLSAQEEVELVEQ